MCLNRDDTSLYLLGGFNTGSVSIDLLKFDIENQKWSRPLVGGPVPPERYCHSVVNIDSNLVVFGGFSVNGKWLNDLHALDTEYAMNSEFKPFVPRLSAYGQCKASQIIHKCSYGMLVHIQHLHKHRKIAYFPSITGTLQKPQEIHHHQERLMQHVLLVKKCIYLVVIIIINYSMICIVWIHQI